ncbi:MAG TPA: alpha/beta hydrolase-fold protein, partial [Gemmatales bacterium]|nr:alpha/beta hydrolase-fold protein [Gemmatales bacterium]
LVILQKEGAPTGRRRGGSEPRFAIGANGMNASPYFGVDMDNFTTDKVAVIDDSATPFPVARLSDVPAGNYTAQAVFHTNRDICLPNAHLNLISKPQPVKWDPASSEPIQLTLTERLPDEVVPKDTATVKYLKFHSKLLSDFHRRPFYYRLAVILPRNFDNEGDKNYLLCVHIGGFGTRYTFAGGIPSDPRFVQILLDGAGPYGDPYQVNSANNGPYGDALTQEVIPHVEKAFRCGGLNRRFTTGGSTGGWVSLALQLYYPDFFNGCWSSCPDPVDFRDYELINIYSDKNAYVNGFQFERPSQRTINGETVMTLRHECQAENVIGRGGKFNTGGKDWSSWNATFGPRGADGLPSLLWDPKTGVIDRSVTEAWKQHDLRHVLESRWPQMGSKLNEKVHVWVGDADDYFLNNAVHRFKAAADKLENPKFNGEIIIAPRKGHTSGWSSKQVLDLMAQRAEATK